MKEEMQGYTVTQDYKFIVTVNTETLEQAQKVITERIDYTEDYGFPYYIEWN